MRFQNKKLGNKGYSLVELIITIAIIVVLTGLSFVTLSLIGSARAKEASVDFDSEISALVSRSKSKMVVINENEYPTLSFCLWVYKDGSKYYAKKGYFNPKVADGAEVTVELATGETPDLDASRYIFVEGENGKGDKGVGFSSKVKIMYDSPTADEAEVSEDGVYIIYNRSGRCIGGDGVYRFYKASNNANIANITINKNGSHQSK